MYLCHKRSDIIKIEIVIKDPKKFEVDTYEKNSSRRWCHYRKRQQ